MSAAPSCSRTSWRARWPSSSANAGSARQRRTKAVSCSPVGDDHGGLAVEHQGHDVAEVAGVGAEGDRRAVGGRLDHVLAAPRAHAAADEGDLRRAPPGAQFADGVDQQDAGLRIAAVCFQTAAALPGHARPLQQLGDFLKPFGMPRGDDQPQLRVGGGQFAVRRPAPAALPAPACCRPGTRRRRGGCPPVPPAAASSDCRGRSRRRRT